MRDITQLHPDLQPLVHKLVAECKKQGLEIGIGECLRSVGEQDSLFAQGRTIVGRIVTNARGCTYSSMHQWGVAFDFYRDDGRGAYNEDGNFFYKVGQVGKSLGLFWGGDFHSITDKPHFQMPEYSPDGTTAFLKTQYGTPEKFIDTWNIKMPKKLISRKSSKNDIVWLQRKFNACLRGHKGFKLLQVDGIYGTKVKNAVLTYWKLLGWNKLGVSSGWNVGVGTRKALSKGRI